MKLSASTGWVAAFVLVLGKVAGVKQAFLRALWFAKLAHEQEVQGSISSSSIF